jgi:hypothetical protein
VAKSDLRRMTDAERDAKTLRIVEAWVKRMKIEKTVPVALIASTDDARIIIETPDSLPRSTLIELLDDVKEQLEIEEEIGNCTGERWDGNGVKP